VTSRRVDLLAASEVETGAVVAVSVGDLDLVVWRTAEGEPCVMDARCPHQWSHLEAEGAVVGDEIVCLAHFWRFDTTGNGVKVAMNGRRDQKSPIGVHPCEERDGRIVAVVDAGP
jgi:phenylpropionate dioxygenase-like ring-hydroxylating dioxygenase large terminal subunit